MLSLSVVCPTFNSSRFISGTLDSILAQTHKPDEIIISDDGSSDNTVHVVEEFLKSWNHVKCVVIRGSHRGPGAARNEAIRQASGEWIAFIDSDDFWVPKKLQAVFAAIETHPEVNIICHSEEHVRRDGSRNVIAYGRWFNPHKPLPAQIYYRSFFSPSAVVCKRKLLLEASLFDETILSGVEDFDLWQRMSPLAKPLFIDEPLGYYFDRAGNLSFGGNWSKWKDIVRLAFRYRHNVSSLGVLYYVSKVTAFYSIRGFCRLFQPAKASIPQ